MAFLFRALSIRAVLCVLCFGVGSWLVRSLRLVLNIERLGIRALGFKG